MRKTLTTIAFALTISGAFAQQDAQFSMNMFNKQVINPGYIGTNNALCATALYRQQWVSFPGAPKTALVSLDARIPPIFGGVGLTFCSDQLGVEKNTIIKLGYSFHLPLGPGVLGIGIDAGVLQKKIAGTWISTDPYTQDAAIPDLTAKDGSFNLGFGLYYTTPVGLYFGISSTNLPQGSLSASSSSTTQSGAPVADAFKYVMARHYYVMAGAPINASANLKIIPSVLVKSDASSTQLDVNCLAEFAPSAGPLAIFGGVSYRLTDAIVAIIGVKGGSDKIGWRVGYSYDVTTSAIKNYSNNTHEILLNFCYKPFKPKLPMSHDNVRNMGRFKEVEKKQPVTK